MSLKKRMRIFTVTKTIAGDLHLYIINTFKMHVIYTNVK